MHLTGVFSRPIASPTPQGLIELTLRPQIGSFTATATDGSVLTLGKPTMVHSTLVQTVTPFFQMGTRGWDTTPPDPPLPPPRTSVPAAAEVTTSTVEPTLTNAYAMPTAPADAFHKRQVGATVAATINGGEFTFVHLMK